MKKYLALLLAALMLIAAFAGCADEKDPSKDNEKDPSANNPVNPDNPDDPEKEETKPYGTFHDYSTKIANTLNILITQDGAPHSVTDMCSASLYGSRINEAGDGWDFTLELASQFPKQADDEGKVWEIKIRDDFKWANGEKITVDDIIYTFQQYADPKQQNLSASTVTQSTYGQIKNIYEYQMGEITSWDEVGMKKIDDYTFQIEMKEPTVSLNVQRMIDVKLVYKPLYEAGMNSDRTATDWGTTLDKFMSAGAFILTEWIPDAKIVLTRNPDYPYADQIKMEKYEIVAIPDTNTAMQLFEKGEVDWVDVPYTAWEQYEDDPRFVEYFDDSLMYLLVNLGNPMQGGALGNINMREALYWGIDRVSLADTLGVYPASRLVRKAVISNPATGVPFVELPADYIRDPYNSFDKVKANEYLTKAFEECKQDKVSFRLLIADNATHIKGAGEIMQKQYQEVFGGKVNLELQFLPANQVYSLRRWNPDDPDAYDLSFGSLLPSASEPRSTFVYYRSQYSPPRFCYNNPAFDAAYESAMNLDLEKDNEAVVKACQDMEKMILDELVVVPVYERPNKVLVQEWVQLPAETGYITGFGFGYIYSTILEK